jgi:hypothetical protein
MTMTNRKTILATLLAALAAAPLAMTPAHAQAVAQSQAPVSHVYTQAELDQMLAPIALYPDALLSQVLMAATYPIEVVEAARWSRANPGLQGDAAVQAVQGEDWDPSVKSLCAFPQILQRMDEKLEWTRALGDAFLAQEPQMMDEVQKLRQRAQAAGNLRSDERIRVAQQGPVIVVEPASPEYFYVPYYDPLEVYGTWWWPDYRPVYWSPWPGYVRPYYRPGISVGFWWGRPIGLSLGFFFGDFDWGRRHVRVTHNSYYYRDPVYVNRSFAADRGRWQHDPQHRRGVDYRQAEVRQRFANTPVEGRSALREGRRAERQAAPVQTQPAARTQSQAQPQPQNQTNAERRADRREDRQAARVQTESAASVRAQSTTPVHVQPQSQPAAQPRTERRENRREERQAARPQAQTAATAQVQPQPQPAAQPRVERREERQAARAQAQPQARPQPETRPQPQARPEPRPQPQARPEPRPQPQARPEPRPQPQARQEQRATMPAAQAPETPRAERQERREQRQHKREERGEKAG